MRKIDQILFRGKTLSNDEYKPDQWVYGYFTHCASRYDDPEKDRVAEIIEIDADRIYLGEYSCLDTFIVLSETVSQWTGLVDKNGVKIFEGDVVQYEGLDCSVQWNTTHSSYILLHRDPALGLSYFHLYEDGASYMEVIGNKWDNPELVGERGG